MNTVEIEKDDKIAALVVINSATFPEVRWKKIKKVGALSRIEERSPLAQKHLLKMNSPFGAIQLKIIASDPFSPLDKIERIGATVMKIATKNSATSRIGAKVNPFFSRIFLEVVLRDNTAIDTKITLRKIEE